jgi:hypothetical protein
LTKNQVAAVPDGARVAFKLESGIAIPEDDRDEVTLVQ